MFAFCYYFFSSVNHAVIVVQNLRIITVVHANTSPEAITILIIVKNMESAGMIRLAYVKLPCATIGHDLNYLITIFCKRISRKNLNQNL
jgi:hypothetical protein